MAVKIDERGKLAYILTVGYFDLQDPEDGHRR